jgi:hypothetical protein
MIYIKSESRRLHSLIKRDYCALNAKERTRLIEIGEIIPALFEFLMQIQRKEDY